MAWLEVRRTRPCYASVRVERRPRVTLRPATSHGHSALEEEKRPSNALSHDSNYSQYDRAKTSVGPRHQYSCNNNNDKDDTSWAVTEVASGNGCHGDIEDDIPVEEAVVNQADNDSGDDRALTPATRSKIKHQAWLDGEKHDSEEYDTDLEEEAVNRPKKRKEFDNTGTDVYKRGCNQLGLVPISYIVRNLGERNIRMRHHYMKSNASAPIAEAIKKNSVIEMLDFTDNCLGCEGGTFLAEMLEENMFVVQLDLSFNCLGSRACKAIAAMLETNTTLKTLILKENLLTDKDAAVLGEALKNNTSLSSLDLSHNKFGQLGGIYFAPGLIVNEGLTDLDLSWNAITQKGAVAIINVLKTNKTLEILDLSWNGLGYTGSLALMTVLKINTRLKVLDISNNHLDTKSAQKLSLGLAKNEGLDTILMNFNPVGEDGVEAILKATVKNLGLKLLGLEKCMMDITISPKVFYKIQEITKSRETIIMHNNVGGYSSTKSNAGVLALFDKFIDENTMDLEALFNSFDKDGSGDLSLEEMKYGLKEVGIRLTSKQLDILLDELDADKSGTIEYQELVDGVNSRKDNKARGNKEEVKLKTTRYPPVHKLKLS